MDVVKRTIEAMRGRHRPDDDPRPWLLGDAAPAADAGDHRRAADPGRRGPLHHPALGGRGMHRADGRPTRPAPRAAASSPCAANSCPSCACATCSTPKASPTRTRRSSSPRSATTRIGLVVDQIIGSHQTVIKSLSKLHADVAMFSGATILGDGIGRADPRRRPARQRSARPAPTATEHRRPRDEPASDAAAATSAAGPPPVVDTRLQVLMVGLGNEIFAIETAPGPRDHRSGPGDARRRRARLSCRR